MQATSLDNLFVVFYSVSNSRCTGSYLVKAQNKRAAHIIVRRIDKDYVRLKAMSPAEAAAEYSQGLDDFLENLEIPKEFGDYTHIESGT